MCVLQDFKYMQQSYYVYRTRAILVAYCTNDWNLQPGLDLLLGIAKRVLVAEFLAADLVGILLGDVLGLGGRIVVPVRVLLAVRTFVNVDNHGAAETQIVLQRYVCVDEAVVGPAFGRKLVAVKSV